MIDVLSKTIALILITVSLALANTFGDILVPAVLSAFAILIVRPPATLVFVAVISPALPIAVSHLVIEPFPKLWPLTPKELSGFTIALMRYSAMTLSSIAWLRSMTNREFAQLCNLVWCSQAIYAVGLVVAGMLSVQRARWLGLRELLFLRRQGRAAYRRRFYLSSSIPAGLQLCFATLASLADTDLATTGRGFVSMNKLAVEPIRPSWRGIVLLAGIAAAISASYLW